MGDKPPGADETEEISGVDDNKEEIPGVDDAEEFPGLDDDTPEDKHTSDKVEVEEKKYRMHIWWNEPVQTDKREIQPQELRQRL